MKKSFILFTLLLLCTITANAQVEHLKFMGIPITGTPYQFAEKLKAKGFIFKYKSEDSQIRKYNGKFAGASVTVSVVSKENLVWKIVVEYPKAYSFNSLRDDYNEMVSQFTKKYGEPSNHYEYFSEPYYDGDGFELQALRMEKCFYQSYWLREEGCINVELTEFKNMWISYEDTDGFLKKREKQNNEIQNDI